MSLTLRIDRVRLGRSPFVAVLSTGCALAIASAAPAWQAVNGEDATPGLAGLLLVGALALASAWQDIRGSRAGRLQVDPSGLASWAAASAPDGEGAAAPHTIRPRDWCVGAGRIRLRAEFADGRRRDIVIARRHCAESQWRALRRWLLWLQRGGAAP